MSIHAAGEEQAVAELLLGSAFADQPLAILLALACLVAAALGGLAVRFPYKLVSLHARVSRAMAQITCGPDWERVLGQLRGRRYVDYLRRGEKEPQAFPGYATRVRFVFVLFTLVAALMFVLSIFPSLVLVLTWR